MHSIAASITAVTFTQENTILYYVLYMEVKERENEYESKKPNMLKGIMQRCSKDILLGKM